MRKVTSQLLNPFTPIISLVILLTVRHTMLTMLVPSGWYWIKYQSHNWYFCLFLSLVCLILYWYCIGIVLILYWYCIDIVLILYWLRPLILQLATCLWKTNCFYELATFAVNSVAKKLFSTRNSDQKGRSLEPSKEIHVHLGTTLEEVGERGGFSGGSHGIQGGTEGESIVSNRV